MKEEKHMFTFTFDMLDNTWSFYCIYAKSEKEALEIFEKMGFPNTSGKLFVIRSIEKH